jgi:hypothetical protein
MSGTFGGNGTDGLVSVLGTDNTPLVQLIGTATEAIIGAGNTSRPGRLSMYDINGNNTVNLTTTDATLSLGGGTEGNLQIKGVDGTPLIRMFAAPNEAVAAIGAVSRPGRFSLLNQLGDVTFAVTAEGATMVIGGERANGVISLLDSNGNESVRIDTQGGGDIWIANGDIAEEFDLDTEDFATGMVVVLAEDGSVVPCGEAYDTRVVGVVAGAGDFKPGMVLDRRISGKTRAPVALLGKVHCWADATLQPIRVGDLLTSSARRGHAQKVTQRSLALGAVIGKALAPLTSGCGLVPIMVTLT